MRTKPKCSLILTMQTALTVLFLLYGCYSVSTAAEPTKSIAFIGNLNNDNVPDTLIALRHSRTNNLPYAIYWGKTSRNERLRHTGFSYPAWDSLRGRFFVTTINNDAVADIVITLAGKVTVNDAARDTSRTVVIYGNDRLRGRSEIAVQQIAPEQRAPFSAAEARRGKIFEDEALRDASGRKSYRIIRTNDPGDSASAKSSSPSAPPDAPAIFRIYPNPAAQTITAEAYGIIAGTLCKIDVSDVLGMSRILVERPAPPTGALRETLDVDGLPPGMYIVRLWVGGMPESVAPLIIHR